MREQMNDSLSCRKWKILFSLLPLTGGKSKWWTMCLNFLAFRIFLLLSTEHIVSGEPKGHYHYSTLFHWEPKGRYRHRHCAAIAPYLVLSGTLLNSDSALLALNWQHTDITDVSTVLIRNVKNNLAISP